MPISLVHVIEINHQSITDFQINQDVTALIANQIRVVTKPKLSFFWESYDGLKSLMGSSDKELADNRLKATSFGQKNNIVIKLTDYSYSFQSFDILVILSEKVEIKFKFLKLEDAEKAYAELLTAASISQDAQEKTR